MIDQHQTEEAAKFLPQLQKLVDKAAKKGIIKKNTAARKKSRFRKRIEKTARV